jgi:hypothetical protein
VSTTYDFDIATQTSNGKVNDGILSRQLEDAAYASGGAFEGVGVEGGKILGRGLLNSPGTIKVTWENALDATDLAAQAALVGAHVGEKYAREFARRGAIALNSEDTGAFKSALSAPLQLSPLSAGLWIVKYNCEVKLAAPSSGPSDRVQIQLTDAGSDIATGFWITDDWMPLSGFRLFDREAGDAFDIDFLFRRRGAGVTAEIRRVQIIIELAKEQT